MKLKNPIKKLWRSSLLIGGLAVSVVALTWSSPIMAQSGVLITSGMGSGASSTARLAAIMQQQVDKVNAIEACGNNGKIYGKSFPLTDVNDCVATFSTSSDASESIVQILDFVTARHKFSPLSREFTVSGDIIANGGITASGDVAVSGALTANTPTSGNEVTTKDYVDTAIAAVAAAGGSARECYDISQNYQCGSGFQEMPGRTSAGGSTSLVYKVCCSIDSNASVPDGYFVGSLNTFRGDLLGGLTGANAKCLTELNSYDWRGKSEAVAAGILTAANVKAFLCSYSSCQNLKPGKNYAFATVNDTLTGGGTFQTPSGGIPLPPLGSWQGDTTRFQQSTFSGSNYWTGRNTSGVHLGATSVNCNGWVTNMTGYVGNPSASGTNVWQKGSPVTSCSSAEKLICMVHPN